MTDGMKNHLAEYGPVIRRTRLRVVGFPLPPNEYGLQALAWGITVGALSPSGELEASSLVVDESGAAVLVLVALVGAN